MTTAKKLIKAAGAAGAGEVTYVDDVFSTYLYEGSGSTQNIVTGIDLSGEGGLVWTKSRTSAVSNQLTDTVSGYRLESDDTSAGEASQGNVTFNSNGHTQASGSSFFNDSGNDFVNWTFRKAPGFFDIVTYTGNSVAGREIPHNLGSVPGMIIVKSITQGQNWEVFHRSAGATKYLILNDTDVAGTYPMWYDTAPTSTVFTVSAENAVNDSGETYVAYLFAHDAQEFGTDSDESIIKCGSYTGNANADGPTIDLGFEPQWVLIKSSSNSKSWGIFDSMRGVTVSGDDFRLMPNSSEVEGTAELLKFTPTGFKLTASNTNTNGSGYEYIYMAIRRPHKPAEEFAATDLFNVDLGDNNQPGFDTGFPVDMGIFRQHESVSDFDIMSRLTQPRRLDFTSGAEANKGGMAMMDYMDGWADGTAANHIAWSWRRAPGYFDVTAWTGDGTSSRAIPHNLEVVPEMIWLKNRSDSGGGANWTVALSTTAPSEGSLNNNNGFAAYGNVTAFAASTFTLLNGAQEINQSSKNYIAYLFASVAGISKVGSYTGTGNDLNVDCGFSAGARFVLIKRTDSSGQWYAWDSVRGIVAGNEPYLRLNSSGAQSTGYDYIDPLSSGFTVPSTGSGSTNANGGTYIFYAIA